MRANFYACAVLWNSNPLQCGNLTYFWSGEVRDWSGIHALLSLT